VRPARGLERGFDVPGTRKGFGAAGRAPKASEELSYPGVRPAGYTPAPPSSKKRRAKPGPAGRGAPKPARDPSSSAAKAPAKRAKKSGKDEKKAEPERKEKEHLLAEAVKYYNDNLGSVSLEGTRTHIAKLADNACGWAPPKSTLGRAVCRSQTIVPRGPAVTLNEKAIAELLTEARELQISGNCMTQQEARVKILNLAIDQRKSRGLDVTEFTISETTMKRCLKNLKEVKRPQIRSERRAQAENELWNSVSLSATV
jgi:hypothetical protein